jgi:magnesium chelatase family protein
MFFKLRSAALIGLGCEPVDIEVDINKGQTNFQIVGLPDASIREAKERIYSAIKNSGFEYPYNFRLLINLAPANLPKEGPMYDLAMAVGLIAASQDVPIDISDAMILGELALDGAVRHVSGVLPLAIYAKNSAITRLFLPEEDAAEAALVKDGPTIYPIKNLAQLTAHLTGREQIAPYIADEHPAETEIRDNFGFDMALVKGQAFAKRALEIAAAGGHNVLMSGPPGSGKTLLARTLPTILPPLTSDESLEVTKIYSIAGLIRRSIVRNRPFRSPHHTISSAALVGGGKWPRPGEISLAHRGVLFLDEFPEFPRAALESMRQPLEDGTVTISRAQGTLTFPARFVLVASQNPCPCGYYDDPEHPCTCTAAQISTYRKKVSGPILDRIDLHVQVPRVKFDELASKELAEPSEKIRERVVAARERQHERLTIPGVITNSEMGAGEIREFCAIDSATLDLLRTAVTRLHLSARAFERTLKVGRTIADLAGSETIKTEHVAEALQYRASDR